jgi:pyruvate dehydrogenase E2 component (dihydrolipoamide acetyltransferase)
VAEFRMPSLGADMEAGTLVEWRIAPGDRVHRGDIVAVVDTDKAMIEVEIWEDGVVTELLVAPGTKVPVGTPLARLGPATEAPAAGAPAAARTEAVPAAAPVAREAPPAPGPPPPPAPLLPSAPPPAGPPLRPAPVPTPQRVPFAQAEARTRATPLARRVARSLGVDLAGVHGSGPGGAVTRADVERAAPAPAPTGAPAAEPPAARAPRAPAPSVTGAPAERGAGMRRAIAAAVARSKREIPHYYLGTRIDLSRALAWLAAENARRSVGDRLLPAVLLLRAVALAAREVPETNGHFVEGAFRPASAVHLGVGISLRQGGLVAPALHDADRKGVEDLMRELADLVRRTRAGVLRSSEIAEATLTVTNLGDQGVESVYGVIQPPQVALVGFGRVAEQPWAQDGLLGVRPVVVATLAADHRVSDGHGGGRFLSAVDRLLQEPEKL